MKQYELPAGSREEGFPVEPYEDVVYIEQLIEEKSRGGIILAGESRKVQSGRVVAVGPGRVYVAPMDATGHHSAAVFVPTRTKLGDYVVFGRYQSGGEPIEYNGKRYLAAREGDLGGKSADGNPVSLRLVTE
jgi:co-chaperonin GroES (HSP10)